MLSSNYIAAQMRSALDAENSDHYGDQEDIIPAINMAVRWFIFLATSTYGVRKSVDQVLSGAARASVFRTSKYSRILENSFPGEVIDILSVNPLPVTESNGLATPSMPNDSFSYHRPDLNHIDSDYSAERQTKEEWELSKRDPFAPGYKGDSLCDSLGRYAYLSIIQYAPEGISALSNKGEITIKPEINKGLCTVYWVEAPAPISVLGNNDIPLSKISENFVIHAALKWIAFKQSDQTNLFAVSTQEFNQYLQAL